MGMTYMDSFSGYLDAQLQVKWSGGTVGGGAGINAHNATPNLGRHGNRALTLTGDGSVTNFLKTPTKSLICGFGILSTFAPVVQRGQFFFLDTTNDNVASVGFSATDDGGSGLGGLTAMAGNPFGSHSLAKSANGIWFQNAYFHVQIKVVLTGAQTISVTVKFNNIVVATVSKTLSAADVPMLRYRFVQGLGTTNAQGYYISDFYVIDMLDGIAPTDFISPTGDIDISPLFPDNVGVTTQFTPDPAHPTTPNWQLVNETVPDGDASYVFDPTTGHTDLYHFPPASSVIPSGSTVYGVQRNCFAKKDDPAGSKLFTPLLHINSNGLNYQGATESLGNDYAYYYFVDEFNYATGNPWQVSEVGGTGSQFGQKVL